VKSHSGSGAEMVAMGVMWSPIGGQLTARCGGGLYTRGHANCSSNYRMVRSRDASRCLRPGSNASVDITKCELSRSQLGRRPWSDDLRALDLCVAECCAQWILDRCRRCWNCDECARNSHITTFLTPFRPQRVGAATEVTAPLPPRRARRCDAWGAVVVRVCL
jgi:hypothetical protein